MMEEIDKRGGVKEPPQTSEEKKIRRNNNKNRRNNNKNAETIHHETQEQHRGKRIHASVEPTIEEGDEAPTKRSRQSEAEQEGKQERRKMPTMTMRKPGWGKH